MYDTSIKINCYVIYHNKSSVNGCFAKRAPSNENNTSVVDDEAVLKTIGKKFTILRTISIFLNIIKLFLFSLESDTNSYNCSRSDRKRLAGTSCQS